MKKNTIITIILIIVTFLALNYYNYLNYSRVVNRFVNNVAEEIKINYPNVNEDNIIKIINSHNNYNTNYLKDYGFLESDISILKSMNKQYIESTIISSVILGVLIILILIINIIKYRKDKEELNNIIMYLKKLNRGIYDLEIIDNKEGLASELKSEIYKTTIMLQEKALQELDDKKKLKDSLSNISHQLKTPLTSILIMLDNLSEEGIDKKTQKEFLEDMKKQIENINFLILAMLKLSRFDANVIKFNKEEINVKKFFWDSIKNVDILRDLKDINIHVKSANDIVFNGDYKWELEALTNILKNAIEHTEELKNVYLTSEDNSIYLKIIIEDEGEGISEEDIKHIFERFYKGKNSSENNFGIGMSLAKEIIERDNGKISVSKRKEGGTKFVIKYYH